MMLIDIIWMLLGLCIVVFIGMVIWSSEWGWRQRVRYLDHDPYYDNHYERALYQYTVTHLNGDVSYVWAHRKTTDGAFAKFHVADDDTWALYTSQTFDGTAIKPLGTTRGFEKVAELEGIKRIEKDCIGRHIWNVVCDYRTTDIDHVEKMWMDG